MTSLAELQAKRSPTSSAWITWLRWIGVLPVALIGGSIVNSFLGALFVAVLGATLSAILLPFFVAAVFVMVGSIIAPHRRAKTALLLVVLYVVLGLIALAMLWSGTEMPGVKVQSHGDAVVSTLGTVAAILGLLCGLYWVRSDESRRALRQRI